MPPDEPRVRTTAGNNAGSYEDGLSVFRGIPFAAAPFGEHRFATPAPVARWAGPRPAKEFSAPPPQSFRMGPPQAAPSDPEPDCLTVNVWTPDLSANLPVLVWIYGGGYLAGQAGMPTYDGAHLAHEGVVVVSFNHRVGVEGFAYFPDAPANRGLLDQVAALEWVQENIAGFGGDPASVTVFGQSAGAGSIAALLSMPRANGLFSRAVLQSVPGTYFTPAFGLDATTRIGTLLGAEPSAKAFSAFTSTECAEATLAFLPTMPDLVAEWGRIAKTITPFSPIVDGDVLPVDPWQALADGASRDVDLLAGWTHDEYRIFHHMDQTLYRAADDEATYYLDLMGPNADAPTSYREAYPDKTPGELIEVVFTDWLFRMATLRLAEHHAAAGGRTFVYELALKAPAENGALGAHHGFDAPLVFGNLDNDMARRSLGDGAASDAVKRVSSEMGTAWLGFAASGDPGWPAFALPQSTAKVFDETTATVDGIEAASSAIWRDYRYRADDLIS
jgi:para-nitrobenzyl esterase